MLETMTKNPGILEAVKEVRHMSLGRWARAMYDGHMKMVRDQQARDAYVRDSGAEQERARLSTLLPTNCWQMVLMVLVSPWAFW